MADVHHPLDEDPTRETAATKLGFDQVSYWLPY